jgi:hypothetical protein
MKLETLDKRLRTEDLFDCLGNEEEKEQERKFDVTSSDLEKLINRYKKLLNNFPNEEEDIFYRKCLDSVREFNYNSQTLTHFSILLEDIIKNPDLEGFALGYYFSSLINNCPDRNYFLKIPNAFALSYLGYRNNGKDIEVHGDSLTCLGAQMRSGNITLYGNGYGLIGEEMNGGSIVVNGDASDNLGENAKGGLIIIYGKTANGTGVKNKGARIIVVGEAGNEIGYEMQGGEIHILGDYDSISEKIIGGNVYHQGVRIIKDGKQVQGEYVKWE